jgi:hypothetical protein
MASRDSRNCSVPDASSCAISVMAASFLNLLEKVTNLLSRAFGLLTLNAELPRTLASIIDGTGPHDATVKVLA